MTAPNDRLYSPGGLCLFHIQLGVKCMSLGDKTVLLRNPWKGETLRINRPAAVKAASLGTHFALGFVTGCVRVFGSCAPFGVAMAARSGGGLGGARACVYDSIPPAGDGDCPPRVVHARCCRRRNGRDRRS